MVLGRTAQRGVSSNARAVVFVVVTTLFRTAATHFRYQPKIDQQNIFSWLPCPINPQIGRNTLRTSFRLLLYINLLKLYLMKKTKATKYALLQRQSDRSFYPSNEIYDEPQYYPSEQEDVPYSSFREETNQHLDKKEYEMQPMNSYYNRHPPVQPAKKSQVKVQQSNPYAIALPNKNSQYGQHQGQSGLGGRAFPQTGASQVQIQQKKQQKASQIQKPAPLPTSQSMFYPNPYQPYPSSTVSYMNTPLYPPPPSQSVYKSMYNQPPMPPPMTSPTNSALNNSMLKKKSVVSSNMGQPVQQPHVPQVTETCSFCDCKQMIPGDADRFYCGKCQQINNCEPKYGFFMCGVCHMKVAYPYRTSDHVECSYCFSLNKVPPFPPSSKQSKVKLSRLDESEIVLPKELREEEEEIELRKKSIHESPRVRREFQREEMQREE